MDKVVITVAPVGAEITKRDHPALPVTPEEIVAEAVACREAGASVLHLHVRGPDALPSMDPAIFAQVLAGVRERTDLIVQFTTGGSVHDSEDDRIAPLVLRPDMASLTCGSVNFGDEVFINRPTFMARLYARMRELGVAPEFEIFDAGHVANALRLVGPAPDHHLHFDFVLGVPGGLQGDAATVTYLARLLPAGASWSATGIGRAHLPVAFAAIAAGGHVRCGFEDGIYYRRGVPATGNAQLVARVARLAEESQRGLARPEEAREILGVAGPGQGSPAKSR